MPVNTSELSGALVCRYREPPPGLTNEWDRIYCALVDPVTVALSYSHDHARPGSKELFEAWRLSLRRSVDSAQAVAQFLHGRSQRTWRAWSAIDSAIAPITSAMTVAIQYLAHPTPTKKGPEATAASLREQIAQKLSGFEARPLLDELAAAVVADCNIQRGQAIESVVGSASGGVQSGSKKVKALARTAKAPRVPSKYTVAVGLWPVFEKLMEEDGKRATIEGFRKWLKKRRQPIILDDQFNNWWNNTYRRQQRRISN